jgi:hypothetical protein
MTIPGQRALASLVAASLLVLPACEPVALGPARETARTLLRATEVTTDERAPQAEVQVHDSTLAVYGWTACTTFVRTRSEYRVVAEREKHPSHGGLMWFPFLLGASFVGLGSAMLANPKGFVDPSPPDDGPATTSDGRRACKGACDLKDARAGGYVLLLLGAPLVLWPLIEGARTLGVKREVRRVAVLGPPLRRVRSCGDEPMVGAQVAWHRADRRSLVLGPLDDRGRLRLSLPELGARVGRGGRVEITVGAASAGQLVLPTLE